MGFLPVFLNLSFGCGEGVVLLFTIEFEAGVVERRETTSRKSLATKGLEVRKAGRCAQAHRGRVVVDSQSMMHVCVKFREYQDGGGKEKEGEGFFITILDGISGSTKMFSRLRS